MTSEQWSRICKVFDRALDRPPDERRNWLETVCPDEPTVRAEVESLLDAYEPDDPLFADEGFPTGWFTQASPGETTSAERGPQARPSPGTRIGGYRLLEEIDTGGMSVVYRAERADEAVEQIVAVKLLRRRLDTDDAEKRFRAERQVLASLDHPNIAQFIDAGVTEQGRFYLVMEHVEGIPITDYAEARSLTVDQRLALMEQVFDAVQAAHRQLVVHRDLKPSNVLVTETEEGPQVKLLDFGIAKLLGDAVPATQPQTRTGRLLMTPSYAAPEQVKGASIDVATDIYALGVLLYELLTDERPHEGESPYAVARAVCEDDPPPPSAAVDGSARQSLLRDDLDAILLKALRKAPDDRYETVSSFLADLDRFRADRPVRAKQGSATYRAKKFLRRNGGTVAATTLIALLLVGYAVTVTVQARRIATQRDRAQTEAARAEEVSQFLVDLFEAADPEEAQGDTIPARTLLRRGAEQVSTLDGQPQVQANLLHTMGRVHRRLGDLDRAAGLIRKSLRPYRSDSTSPPSAEYAEALSELGLLLRDQGNYEESASRLRKAVELRRTLDTPPRLATELMRLSYVERQLGNLDAAQSTIEEALQIQKRVHGPDHISTAESYFNLAAILREKGNLKEAERYQRQSLSTVQSEVDGPHPGLATNFSNMGLLLEEQGRLAEAEQYHRKAINMNRELYGTTHQAVATSLQNLASLLVQQNQFEAARSHLQDVLDIRRTVFDAPHPSIARSLHSLGTLALRQDRLNQADSLFQRTLSIRRSLHDSPHPQTASLLRSIGILREEQGRLEAAADRFQAAISTYEQTVPSTHSDLAIAKSTYGSHLLDRERPDQARPLLRSAYRILMDDPSMPFLSARAARRYGRCLRMLGQYEEAETALKKGFTLVDTLGLSDPTSDIREQMDLLYEVRNGSERTGR